MSLLWNLPIKEQLKLALHHPGCLIIGIIIGIVIGIAWIGLYAISTEMHGIWF